MCMPDSLRVTGQRAKGIHTYQMHVGSKSTLFEGSPSIMLSLVERIV